MLSRIPLSRVGVKIATFVAVTTVLLLVIFRPFDPVQAGYHETGKSFVGTPAAEVHDIREHSRNATLGFQKIFVINLKSRTDRRDRMLLSSKMTGIDVEFIEAANNVSDKAIPPGGDLTYPMGIKGCWRSHMDALAKIVEEDISSALILEDDIDWDVNLHSQFSDLSKAMHVLTHPTPDGVYLDPTWPEPSLKDKSNPVDVPLNATVKLSTHSPYGDEWDMLWLGHCQSSLTTYETMNFQRGRVTWHDDSVPSHQWLNYGGSDRLTADYPNHTRAIHHSYGNVCTFGYAVTQKMARRMLYHVGVRTMNAPIDLEYREFCEGHWTDVAPRCYTSEPPYFSLHRPVGNANSHSDINTKMEGYQENEWSPNLRYSAMQNIKNWVEGVPLVDIAPDHNTP